MTRKIIPFVAALGLLLVFIVGPGRTLLPSAGPARPAVASSVAGSATGHEHEATGNASTIGLAPSPIVAPAATAARVTLQVKAAADPARGYTLEATVVGPDGRPAEASLRFYEVVDLFGTREMQIGAGVADGRGVVAIPYLPARTGAHDLVARSSAIGKITAGEGRASFDASVSAPQSKVERPLLAAFSDRVPYAAGLIVLSVWTLIAFALLATARGVIGGARRTTRKGEPA